VPPGEAGGGEAGLEGRPAWRAGAGRDPSDGLARYQAVTPAMASAPAPRSAGIVQRLLAADGAPAPSLPTLGILGVVCGGSGGAVAPGPGGGGVLPIGVTGGGVRERTGGGSTSAGGCGRTLRPGPAGSTGEESEIGAASSMPSSWSEMRSAKAASHSERSGDAVPARAAPASSTGLGEEVDAGSLRRVTWPQRLQGSLTLRPANRSLTS